MNKGEELYTVEHWYEKVSYNTEDEKYEAKETKTTTEIGKIGETAQATAKEVEGFEAEIPPETVAEDGSTVVKVYYNRKTITLTFNPNGGVLTCAEPVEAPIKTLTGKYGAPLAESVEASRLGYTFTGWDSTVPETFPAEDTTYIAQWTREADYTITYNLNGGTNASTNPTKYNVDTPITFASPTRLGYIFDGWYETSGFTGTATTKIEICSRTGNITLYAKWTPKTITLTFNANGGTFVSTGSTNRKTLEGKYGTPLTEALEVSNGGEKIPLAEALEVSRQGYTFTGWNPSVPTTFPADDATFTATWAANTASITITLPSTVPSEIGTLSYNTSDSNIKFTATNSNTTITSYAWWLDGKKTTETGGTFTLKKSDLKIGIHTVMVVVNGLYSSTITVEVTD